MYGYTITKEYTTCTCIKKLFFLPVIIFANYIFFFYLGNIFRNYLAVCTRSPFKSSVNICGINLAGVFRTLEICFKMKWTNDSNMQTYLAISRNRFPGVSFYFFPAKYCFIFDELCTFRIFLFCTWRKLPYKTIKLSKIQYNNYKMHYRMTEFFAKFHVSSNCFNIRNPFPNHFCNIGQRLVLIK